MDPNACVRRLISAARDEDWNEARYACADLRTWLARGGFTPDPALWLPLIDAVHQTMAALDTDTTHGD